MSNEAFRTNVDIRILPVDVTKNVLLAYTDTTYSLAVISLILPEMDQKILNGSLTLPDIRTKATLGKLPTYIFYLDKKHDFSVSSAESASIQWLRVQNYIRPLDMASDIIHGAQTGSFHDYNTFGAYVVTPLSNITHVYEAETGPLMIMTDPVEPTPEEAAGRIDAYNAIQASGAKYDILWLASNVLPRP